VANKSLPLRALRHRESLCFALRFQTLISKADGQGSARTLIFEAQPSPAKRGQKAPPRDPCPPPPTARRGPHRASDGPSETSGPTSFALATCHSPLATSSFSLCLCVSVANKSLPRRALRHRESLCFALRFQTLISKADGQGSARTLIFEAQPSPAERGQKAPPRDPCPPPPTARRGPHRASDGPSETSGPTSFALATCHSPLATSSFSLCLCVSVANKSLPRRALRHRESLCFALRFQTLISKADGQGSARTLIFEAQPSPAERGQKAPPRDPCPPPPTARRGPHRASDGPSETSGPTSFALATRHLPLHPSLCASVSLWLINLCH
jgi:hypothetical protein